MEDKARRVSKKVNHWKRLSNLPRVRILEDFNQSTLDRVGPLWNGHGMKV